ncbi:MAG: hypothetical protein DRO15_00600 [Thermoprotei archaeon]|nr:MAG: hypothetical protein DRO15_00600 [Thermoprotei archaeon]
MVWLSKREVITYLLVLEAFGENTTFNTGEAADTLSIVMPRRVAYKVLKKLWKKGFLERISHFEYRVKPLKEAFITYLLKYLALRIEKHLKSYGETVDVYADEKHKRIIVKFLNRPKRLSVILEAKIPKFIEINHSSS